MTRSLLALFALGLTSCTEAALKSVPDPPPPPVDNRLAVEGEFCTLDPAAIEFPVKILFVVDISQSMAVTDPPDPEQGNTTARSRAVVEVIGSLLGTRGVEIGILTFQSNVNAETPGNGPVGSQGVFLPLLDDEGVCLRDPDPVTGERDCVAQVFEAAFRLQSQNGQTNYQGALESAYATILADVQRADQEDARALARSKYVVIFLSDGFPNPVGEEGENGPEAIKEVVGDFRDLERDFRLGELRLHTVYLSGRTPPQFQQEPIVLLTDMAEIGGGTFRNVGNGERINFLDIDFTSFRRIFSLKTFLAFNRNQRPQPGLAEATDSDGDFLSDVEEDLIGTDPASRDTDGDGYSDLLEHRLRASGFDPLDGNVGDCTDLDPYNRRDEDGDGLLNCEERLFGTNPRFVDSDADGLTDLFEVAFQLAPAADDFFADADRDGVANGFEIRDHTNPLVDDRTAFREIRYRYEVRERGVRGNQVCYDFRVENLRLMPTLGEDRGRNDVYLVFGQSPFDDPLDEGEFRVACVRGRFLLEEDLKVPANGRVVIREDDFKVPGNPGDEGVFDPDVDCVDPLARREDP